MVGTQYLFYSSKTWIYICGCILCAFPYRITCFLHCLRTHFSEFFPKGHFLVLRPGSALWASGSCTFHIASPVVFSSGPQCRLRLAYFQTEPRMGNLSFSVKLTNSAVINSLSSVSREKSGIRLELVLMILQSGLENNLKLYCLLGCTIK